jgi:hypothetical protein
MSQSTKLCVCDASASDGHARSTGRSDIGARVELTFNATLDLLFFRPFRFDLFHNQFADLTMAASSAFSDLRDKARLVFSRAEEPSDDASEQQPDRLDEIAQYCPQLTWQQVRQATCERGFVLCDSGGICQSHAFLVLSFAFSFSATHGLCD